MEKKERRARGDYKPQGHLCAVVGYDEKSMATYHVWGAAKERKPYDVPWEYFCDAVPQFDSLGILVRTDQYLRMVEFVDSVIAAGGACFDTQEALRNEGVASHVPAWPWKRLAATLDLVDISQSTSPRKRARVEDQTVKDERMVNDAMTHSFDTVHLDHLLYTGPASASFTMPGQPARSYTSNVAVGQLVEFFIGRCKESVDQSGFPRNFSSLFQKFSSVPIIVDCALKNAGQVRVQFPVGSNEVRVAASLASLLCLDIWRLQVRDFDRRVYSEGYLQGTIDVVCSVGPGQSFIGVDHTLVPKIEMGQMWGLDITCSEFHDPVSLVDNPSEMTVKIVHDKLLLLGRMARAGTDLTHLGVLLCVYNMNLTKKVVIHYVFSVDKCKTFVSSSRETLPTLRSLAFPATTTWKSKNGPQVPVPQEEFERRLANLNHKQLKWDKEKDMVACVSMKDFSSEICGLPPSNESLFYNSYKDHAKKHLGRSLTADELTMKVGQAWYQPLALLRRVYLGR